MTRDPVLGRGIRAGVRRMFRLPSRSRAAARCDADEELDAFLAARVERLVACGMTPDAARTEALRRLGAPLDEVREALRTSAEHRAGRERLRQAIGELRQDLRQAVRQLAKRPGFTAVALLTLALGIGANTAIFSVVHRLLLAPLPYPNGERIVMPMLEDANGALGSPDRELIAAWAARTDAVEAIAGAVQSGFAVRPDGTVDSIPNAWITSNFLRVLGARPVLGRTFTVDEERSDAAVTMLGHGFWQRAYGGRADVLGETVELDGRPYTIIGVMPPGLSIPLSSEPVPDLWLPATLAATVGRGGSSEPQAFAELRRGASVMDATKELQSVAESLSDSTEDRTHARVMRAQDFLDPRELRAVVMLAAAVGAVLLIACTNVANLQLVRAWARRREFAVRAALGAGRGRIARQLLTESVLLALAGGALGVAVAWLLLRIVIALRPPALEHLADVRLSPTVLLWSLGVSVATGVLFGSAPAILAGARRAGDVLRSEARTASAGVASRRVRSGLIVLEIAASVVLLVSAGLLVRTFAALQQTPLGFEPRGLVAVEVLMGPRNRERVQALRAEILERVRALPGVVEVAIGGVPGQGMRAGGLETEAGVGGDVVRVPVLGTNHVTPDYFRVARIALVEGRLPAPATADAGRAIGLSTEVVVSRGLARRLWPYGHAVGSRVRTLADDLPPGREAPWATVVGVVDDVRMPGIRGDLPTLQLYTLIPSRFPNAPVLVRSEGSGVQMLPTVKRTITAVDRTILARDEIAGEAYLRDALAPSRFAMALLTAFSSIALLLAAVGLYGVVAYGVSQRTHEIGVRVALGAEPGRIVARVVGGGLRLAAAGVAIGTVLAAATSRLLASLLYGVPPLDPVTFTTIALLVVVIALAASYVPARRALRIDPTEALRAE